MLHFLGQMFLTVRALLQYRTVCQYDMYNITITFLLIWRIDVLVDMVERLSSKSCFPGDVGLLVFGAHTLKLHA